MATYNIDKITSPSGDVYKLQDKVSGYTTNTGTVTQITAGTGLRVNSLNAGGIITGTGTINHINSVTAGTVGTSSATSGSTLAVPYITYDAQGHITATGTHTHTVTSTGLQNLLDGSATGSVRGINTLSDSSYTMGTNAISIGNNTKASGNYSFVEGYVDSYTKTVPGETVEVAATVSSVIEGYTDTGYLTITFTDPQYSINDLSIGDIIRRETNPQQQIPIEEIDLTNNRIKLPDGSGFSWARDVSVIVTMTLEPTTLTLDYGAYGIASHAEGFNTLASGDYSHASNEGTIAASDSQTAIGKYNIADEDDDYIFIIGNGTNSDTRSNALRVDWNGNLQIAGDLQDMDGNSLLSGGGGGSSTGTEVHYVDVVKGTAPSSQKYTEFRFKERNGSLSSNVSNLAVFGVTADTNGDYRTYMRGYYPIANNSDSANITIYTRPNGNNWIDLESWVNVLGGHLDICSSGSGVLGFRYGSAASATATITNTGGSELATNGNFSVGGNVSTNGKTSSTQAKAGAYITTSGNIHLTGDTSTGAKINFYFGKSTSVTTSIQEVTSGYLHLIGNAFIIQNNILTKGTAPSADSNRTLLFVDKNGYNSQAADVLGGIWCGVSANNTSYFNIRAYRSNISSATFGELSIQYPASGDPVCAVNCTLQAKIYNGSSATMVGSNSTSGNRVALFATPGSTTFQIGAQWGGSTYTTKSVTVSSSDIRLKENIKDTEVEALPIINQIKVREFNWKDGKHQKIGVVADELEEIDECLAVGGGYDEDGCMNIKSVDTFYLTGYLTKGIQELSKENEELKERIKKLETTLSKISVS